MSDEGGTWNSGGGGQRWDGGFTVLQEVNLTKDLNRREDWSDISDDESPAVYADISHSSAYQYHAVQPKETVWDSSYFSHESPAALHETPTASSVPFQESIFWRQQQQPQVALPEVASGSAEYPAASYPPAFYPSLFYPPAICQLVEESTVVCSLDKRGEIEKEEKKTSRNVSSIDQTVAAEKHKEDCPKSSEAEGKESVTSSLAGGPTSKVESLETTKSGHLSLEEPYSQNPTSSGQKHCCSDSRMLPESDASIFCKDGQQYEHNNAGQQGGSAVPVCVSNSELSLDSCLKNETTILSERFVSKLCDPNPKCKNISVPLVTAANELQEMTQKDMHHQVFSNSDGHEAKSVDISTDGRSVSMQSQSSAQEQSKQGRGPKRKVAPQGSRTQDNPDVQPSTDETLAKAMGMSLPSESIPAISDENRLIGPHQYRGTSMSGMLRRVTPEGGGMQDNSDVQTSADKTLAKEMGTSSPTEYIPVISDEKRADVPVWRRGTSKSGKLKRKTLKGSRSWDNPDVTDETSAKAMEVPSPPAISNEKRAIVPDQLRGTSDELGLDKPCQDSTNIGTSKVIQQPSLVSAETDSVNNGSSRKVSLGLTGILTKQKKKVGRPFKKKTLLKMAKLLKIAKECEEDPKDTYVNETTDACLKHTEKNDPQRQNISLISPNEQSCPCVSSFPRDVKEYNYNLNISPLPKNPIQDPKAYPPKSLKDLSETSKGQEDCMDHLKKRVPATQCKAKSCKQQRIQELSICNVTQDPKVVPETVLARETRLSASRFKKIHKKKNDLNAHVSSQSSIVTLQQKPVNQPVLEEASAIKQTSKLHSTPSSTKKSSRKRGIYIKESKNDTCEEKSNLSVKNSVFDSQTSEAVVPPQTPTTRKLTKKRRRKMLRKAGSRARLQLNSVDPQISPPQKELQSTIAIEEKIKEVTKIIQVEGAVQEKDAKGYVSDTQKESEFPCEVVDENELKVMTNENTDRQVVSTADEVESIESTDEVPVEGSAQVLSKRGRGPKRRGKKKRNPLVLPSNKAVVHETRPERSMKPPKIAPKENVKRTSEKMVSNEGKGQNDKGQIEPNGLPLQKDVSCGQEETSQSLNSPQPLGEKRARKRKVKDDGENVLNLNNCSVSQTSNSSEFTLNVSDCPITPPKLAKLGSNIKPIRKADACRNSKKKEKNVPEASQSVLTEKLLQSDSTNQLTQVAQEIQQTPKGRKSKKKVGIPKMQPASQEKTWIMGTAETLPKTRTPRKSKKEVELVPTDNEGQSSTANSSFDFAEEEFQVPVIKVSPRKDVSLKITTPQQSCLKMPKKKSTRIKRMGRKGAAKSRISQEIKQMSTTNICSELPEIKSEPLVVPVSVSKPVEKQTRKQRKFKSSLEESVAQHSDPQVVMEKSGCNTTEDQEGGQSTEIKMEQAEFALSAVDMGPPAVSPQSPVQTTDYMAMLKRKPGRPFKKKTLLRMAKILEIVQEAGSGSKENDGIANFVEGILPKKQHQPKVKKEKVRPFVSPTRRSLRTFVPGKSETELHSLSSHSMDTDHEENTDTSSSSRAWNRLNEPDKCSTNTLASDSNEATVHETDKQAPHTVTEGESTAVRTLKKRRRRRKVFNPKKKKMSWTKLCQQLANVPATQEEFPSSNSENTASVSTNNIEISCKVSSVPMSCKEEQLEHAILNNPTTSDFALEPQSLGTSSSGLEKTTKLKASTLTQSKREGRGRRGVKMFLVEDANVSSKFAPLPTNQEKEYSDLIAGQSFSKLKRKTAHKNKTYLKKSKLKDIMQTVSELNKYSSEMNHLNCSENRTKVKAEEFVQSVSATQVSKLRRSSCGLSSASLSTADKGPRQPEQNLGEEMQSSKQGDTSLNESKVKYDDPSLEIHNDNVTLPSSGVQEYVPMPGQLKQKKRRKRRKRKRNSRTSKVVKSAKITDTTNNSDASLTVAVNTSECQSTSVKHDDTSKKIKSLMEKPMPGEMEEPSGTKIEKGMDERAQKSLLELSENEPADVSSEKADASTYEDHTVVKNCTPPKSIKILSYSETPPRRSVRGSKIASLFHRSEKHTPTVGEIMSSPEKDGQDIIQSPKKTFQPSKSLPVPTEEQVVPAVSFHMVETTGCSVSDNEHEPDLEPSTDADNEITEVQASSTPVGKTAEAVIKKRHRQKKRGWGNRRSGKHTSDVAQVNEQPAVQSVKAVVTEEKNSFAPISQLNDTETRAEELFASEPLEDYEEESQPADRESVMANLLVHSGCQTSLSMNEVSQSPQDVQKVDGCTQYSEEDCREQKVMPPSSLNLRWQSDKKPRASMKCRFCRQSFRHISAYTVHQRLHTGEKPYQCKDCGKRFAQVSKLKSHMNVHKATGSMQCPCCSQRFFKKEQLTTHFKIHLPSVDHISSTKQKTQASPNKPLSTLISSSNGVFNCSVCEKGLPSGQKLCIHKHTHKGECLSCKDCGKTFRKQSTLTAHERVHWPLKPYACSICGKGFSKLQALKAHSLEHTGETPFFCSYCGYACSDLPLLRAHQSSRICSIKKQDNMEGFLIQMGADGQVNTPNFFKCHLCKKLLSHWCQYTLHLQTHLKARPYLCHMCGQSYETDSDVRVHCRDCCKSSGEEKACLGPLSDIWTSQETVETSLMSQEPDSPEHMDEQSFVSPDISPVHTEDRDPVGPYDSQTLSPTPSNVSILSSHPSLDCYIVSSIHARTKTLHKRFECPHCGQTFRLFSFLRVHLQTHLPGNKYTCGLCGRVFQRWHKLWLHQRLHQEKGRSFTCSDCNVQFHFLGLYREHLREHAEQRPYACPLCPEQFVSEENLNAHQCENHRIRRTLRCNVCGKGFSSLRNWVKHSLLHNGRSSHRCLLCDHSFTSNRVLQDHLKTHNNDLRFPTSEIPSEPLLFPHQCWHCNASFSTGELLYAHQICHAVGGKPPARPVYPPTNHRNTSDVTKTVPPTTVLESSSVPEPSAEQAPVPEITEEDMFHYAHPDSLYVVPDPTPPPPIRHTHSFSRSRGPSYSQANISTSQQVITLDENSLPDAADTNPNVPSTSQTIPDSSLIANVNLPQTSSQQTITESPSSPVPAGSSASHLRGEPTLSLQVEHTLPPKHDKSRDAVKRFSITVQLQESKGFQCADCNLSLSSIKQLHKHYLKHAKGVLTKLCV